MDALGLWDPLEPYNVGLKPRGTVFPYFGTILKEKGASVKVRFLLLEGWQTLHDFVRTRLDRDFGFYSSPIELPHLELVVLTSGEARLFRHDTGYMPAEAKGPQRTLGARLLWEAYGILMRMESDPKLPLRYADDKAIFARVETAENQWEDAPLVIPDPAAYAEKVSYPKADVKAAQDLPFAADETLDLDFRLLPNVMTKEARPRCVYGLVAIDAKTGERAFECRVSVLPEVGLRGLWESMPVQVLKELVQRGRVPGEIRLRSHRVFRLLRTLCPELPFKLSLHDALPALDRFMV